MDEIEKKATEFLIELLEEPISPDECALYNLERGTSRIKAVLLAQIARAYAGDTKAADFLFNLAYSEPFRNSDKSDPLSEALEQIAQQLKSDPMP